VGHIASVIGVGGSSCGDAAQKITGNDYVGSRSADAFGGTLSKGIYAAWSHVAVSTAQSQLSKTALGLLLFEAIPGSLQTGPLADIEHLPAGGIYGSITNILCHISTSIISSEHKSGANPSASI
jgi:hypothetical protein